MPQDSMGAVSGQQGNMGAVRGQQHQQQQEDKVSLSS
jgi:hypothetical protein